MMDFAYKKGAKDGFSVPFGDQYASSGIVCAAVAAAEYIDVPRRLQSPPRRRSGAHAVPWTHRFNLSIDDLFSNGQHNSFYEMITERLIQFDRAQVLIHLHFSRF